MYPSSSSSSSQGSLGPSGLVRYGSAPGSLLTTAVDSAVGASCDFSTSGSQPPLEPRYFSGESSPAAMESSCKANAAADPKEASNWGGGLQGSLGSDEIATASNLKNGVGSSSSPSLVRHSSSPAGFLNHLNTALTGFSFTRGVGSYDPKGAFGDDNGISRLNSQLSFTRQDSLSRISEKDENIIDGGSTDNGQRKTAHSYATASFGMGPWDDSNAFMFSAPPSKRAKNFSGDIVNGHNTVESQFQFSLSQTALEMATMENLLQIPQDSVPCKTRAKRGCATHPRSIAERDRRNRISGKLKKLQDLVPNMDKQTSYADMLDLAVQHIKGLQNQVQKLKNEVESCTCGCKTTM